MDKIEKLFRKISKPERQRLRLVLELLSKKDFKSLDIKKLKGQDFYRVRKGRFRIIFRINKNKQVKIFAIKIRNEGTYRI